MNKFSTLTHGFSALVPVVLTEIVHTNEDGTDSTNDKKAVQIHENKEAAEKFVSLYNEMVKGRHNSRAYVENSYNMELRDLMNTKKWDFMGMDYHSFR